MTRQPSPPILSPVGGSATVLIATSAAGSCSSLRYRRHQQLPYRCLENRTSNPTLQQLWAHSNRCALPHRRFQMESHRAPPAFGNLQKLGRRAARQLPQSPQLHPQHMHPHRAHSLGPPRPTAVSNRHLTRSRAGSPSLSQTTFDSGRLELYDCSDVNLLLRQPLVQQILQSEDREIRVMLELRLLDKTWDEVGKELGMSGGQARLRLQRALKDLRGDRGDT